MKTTLAAALAAAAALGACQPGPTPGATNSADQARLDAGKALAATMTTLDGAVNAAETAHQLGALTGANWRTAQQAAQLADTAVAAADAAYASGDYAAVSLDLAKAAAEVATLEGLTPATAPASNAAR